MKSWLRNSFTTSHIRNTILHVWINHLFEDDFFYPSLYITNNKICGVACSGYEVWTE